MRGIDSAQSLKAGEFLICAHERGARFDCACREPGIIDVVATGSEGVDEIGDYFGMAITGDGTTGAGMAPQIVFPESTIIAIASIFERSRPRNLLRSANLDVYFATHKKPHRGWVRVGSLFFDDLGSGDAGFF